jgi:hypothetical protein
MSKYDDVQQFKDKINLKDIDYKEFPKEESTSTFYRWPIVEQVAGNEGVPLPSQPPAPVNTAEFSSTTPFGLPQSSPLTAAKKENVRAPDHISHHFEHLVPPVAPNPITAPAPQPASTPTRPVQESRFNSSAAELTAVSQGDSQRFKQLFSKKSSSAGEAKTTGRHTLLKPLLESIASCR